MPGVARYLDAGAGEPTRTPGVLTDPAAAAAYVKNVSAVLNRG